MLSGYVGDVGFLNTLAEIVTDLKKINPDLQYVCDPVLGDFDQGMYVPRRRFDLLIHSQFVFVIQNVIKGLIFV